MARKDYVWDSEAARGIEQQELDKHYKRNEAHYRGLARDAWKSLQTISAHPDYLKADDLTDALRPIVDRDAVTLRGMAERGLPDPNGRLGPQWYSWFTHYVVEMFMALLTEEKGDRA
jgi:hypothetical protein